MANDLAIEDMCRRLLEVAIRNGLVTMVEGKRPPLELSSGDLVGMANLLNTFLGSTEYLIDLATDPFLPEGWKVEEHQKGDIVKWTKAPITLHLDKGQQNGKWIGGHDLRKALKDQKVLNANVLDFLLKHPELIPEEWKGKAIFFWGTIYRDSGDGLSVRCLYWRGGRWGASFLWLADVWGAGFPAVLLAN